MMFLGAFVSLCAVASAFPFAAPSSGLELSGNKLKSLVDVLRANGGNINFDVDQSDQNISCVVSYTLTLGGTAPPYTIDLATFDLSNCTYTGP
ncbi:hypothetical protein N7468_005847 [Penicillium chermesinum]|uniref:Uncharacterized protein n=1 Tax=Penicillium chermesinum TaxID=63820 RepID=A0A9W9NZY5_9EURO|nr:uncharacterized protein N7468_005847 [Penicillium chermesinum]KAJ5232891.1 hypothetical protein N7468_005847 [Penicillium chermesinum]KAJ6172544.1 hypothetical protein N7470_001611 [Penicillium chermesinum]